MAGFDSNGRLRNQRHETFCRLFVHGHPGFRPDLPKGEGPPDTRNNATQSYVQAGYQPGSHHSARQGGYRLLQRSDIHRRIQELREVQEQLERTRLRRWGALVPAAQQLLLDAVHGKRDVTAAQISAAKEILEQAIGPARLRFQAETGDGNGALNVTVYGAKS